MLKSVFKITLLVAAVACSNAQAQTKSVSVKLPINIHQSVFEQARVLGDVNTVISSLNYLIASDPQQYGTYADTLAQVYLNAGYFVQCNNLSSILLQKNPGKESLMSMKAASLKQLSQNVDAAELYSKLYNLTKKYPYGIELMQLQLGLQRLPECIQTTSALLSQEIKDTDKIAVPTKDNKSTQEIPVKAVVQYVQGLAYNAAKEKEKAISAIEKALTSEKNFELAQAFLNVLKNPTELPKSEEIKK